MSRRRIRAGLLYAVALTFTAIAVASLVAPDTMAEGLGFRLDSSTARNEFRAIYVGLWIATAVQAVVAARRVENALLGDLTAGLVFGQVAGRLLSVALGDPPGPTLWAAFALETIGSLAIWSVRP